MGDSATVADHLTMEQLEAGLDHIRRSPKDGGPVVMIVRRPEENAREVAAEGELDVDAGLAGDNWKTRGSASTPDGSADPVAQITIMNSRVLALLARSEERWKLSGDQLIIDMDMSIEGLPPGTRLRRWIGGHRGVGEASHGLREVRRPFRRGRAEVREHAYWKEPEAPRRQHEDRPVRDGPRRRRRRAPLGVSEGRRSARADLGSGKGSQFATTLTAISAVVRSSLKNSSGYCRARKRR